MKDKTAIERLKALSHATRLKAFRSLIRKGPRGARVTDIAAELVEPVSTVSAHLQLLARAGLIDQARNEAARRERFYTANLAAMRDLMAFLVQDCCEGRPEICAVLPDREAGQ